MLQIARERETIASTEPSQHLEGSVKTIAPQLPLPIHDTVRSICIGLRDVASETALVIQQLSQATVEQAIDIGQRLWRMQRDLKRKEYKIFLLVLGWGTAKARKFINLAKTFDGFVPSQLIGVELTTLLSLCSSRYSLVVAQLRGVQDITQQLVEQLIEENRPARSPKQDRISGWKQNRVGGGRRYEVVLHDEETGLSIEQQAEAEGILPQRVIAEAIALRSQYKSSPVQITEYVAAQLEELPTMMEHARSLDKENRLLMHQLRQQERKIAELEAKLTERVISDSVEPEDEVAMPLRACAKRIASRELNEHLEYQPAAIAPEKIAEYELETTDYSEPEQESEHKEPDLEDVQNPEVEPQVINVGDRVEIVSSRQGAEFVWQIGVAKVANTVGCVVEVLNRTLWFCLDELVLASAAPQTPPE